METLTIVIFVIGYAAIAFEHPLKIDKAAAALLTGIFCWVCYVMAQVNPEPAVDLLMHHLGNIASILFFLLGAMTIVELIDSHDGFAYITDKIKTRNKLKLLWIIALITFFLSSLLDNLTTAIVMTSLCAKMLSNKEDRLWFTGIVIIAANAGGAFSPLGDVTTTMLWIGGQISAQSIMMQLFLPSLAVCLVPTIIISFKFKGQTFAPVKADNAMVNKEDQTLMLIIGAVLLLLVPVFKMATHLPPFMGMLFSLSILWIIVTIRHVNKPQEEKKALTVTYALQRIDASSILFFLGILLAVSAIDSFGLLKKFAAVLDHALGNIYGVGAVLGLVSALVDNVPLVAAAQGMYDLSVYPMDHHFWEFIALTTGTGGSAIIIGSAAGVAAMGMENINFMWYLKKITWLALAGFLSGIAVFLTEAVLM